MNWYLCFCLALFNAFDENQDGHIDFREIACGISTCCRGPVAERFACKSIISPDRSDKWQNIEGACEFGLPSYGYTLSLL
jgi:hypothetical protein